MSKTILIACKLPHGIVLQGPGGLLDTVKLNGTNTAMVPGAPGLTHVPEAKAQYLLTTYAELDAFKSNAIYTFGSDSVADIVGMTEDLASERTGFEGMDPDRPAAGMQPEDPNALKAAKKEAESKAGPRKGVSKADKAAATQAAAALGQ